MYVFNCKSGVLIINMLKMHSSKFEMDALLFLAAHSNR